MKELIESKCEIWKDVEGYEGYYRVSNEGRVMGLDRVVAHPYWGTVKLKGISPAIRIDKKGYAVVKITREGKTKRVYVHRLVATAFCQGKKDGLVVNHKDAIKTNNNASNLEWVTIQENVIHSFRMGRKLPSGQHSPFAKLLNADACVIREASNKGATKQQLAAAFGVSSDTIRKVVKGEHYKEATEKHANHEQRVADILNKLTT